MSDGNLYIGHPDDPEGWTDIGHADWETIGDESTAEVLDGDTWKPITSGEWQISVPVDVDSTTLGMIYGEKPQVESDDNGLVSMRIEFTETRSLEPPRPNHRAGWKAALTLANYRAKRDWRRRHAAWVAQGKPGGPIKTMLHLPAVRLTEVDDL